MHQMFEIMENKLKDFRPPPTKVRRISSISVWNCYLLLLQGPLLVFDINHYYLQCISCLYIGFHLKTMKLFFRVQNFLDPPPYCQVVMLIRYYNEASLKAGYGGGYTGFFFSNSMYHSMLYTIGFKMAAKQTQISKKCPPLISQPFVELTNKAPTWLQEYLECANRELLIYFYIL